MPTRKKTSNRNVGLPVPLIDGYSFITDEERLENAGWVEQPIVGGEGHSWLCECTRTRRLVVIKVFTAGTRKDTAVSLVKSLSAISNRNVMCVNDHGTILGDQPYIVTERIGGSLLPDFLATLCNSPIDGRARGYSLTLIVYRLALIAADANDARLIHRDIKPSNIIVGRDEFSLPGAADIPYLIDFGLPEVRLLFTGTTPFASLAQMQGDSATQQDDIHALAVVYYFLFAGGRYPYRPSSLADMRSVKDAVAGGPLDPNLILNQHHIKLDGELALPFPCEPFPKIVFEIVKKAISGEYATMRMFASAVFQTLSSFSEPIGPGESILDKLEALVQSSELGSLVGADDLLALRWWQSQAKTKELRDIREEPYASRSVLFWAIELGEQRGEWPEASVRLDALATLSVKFLLKYCPSLLGIVDKFGLTPLHLACRLGLVGVVEALLDAGAVPYSAASRRVPLGILGGGGTPFYEAAFCQHEANAKRIMQLLMETARRLDVDVNRLLVNAVSLDGFSPLMVSIWRNNHETADYLASECNADKPKWSGTSKELYFASIHTYCAAMQRNDRRIVGWLRRTYKHFHDVPAESVYPRSISPRAMGLFQASMSSDSVDFADLLAEAQLAGDRMSQRCSFPPFSRTLLHQAAERGNMKIVTLLIDAHADLLVRNNHGRTPRDLVPPERSDLRDELRRLEYRIRFGPPSTAFGHALPPGI